MEKEKEFDEIDLEDFELNEIDPIYVLWIHTIGYDGINLDSHLVGEFQYEDDAKKAFDGIVLLIDKVKEQYDDAGKVKKLIVEVNTTVGEEYLETVCDFTKEY